MGLIDKKLLFLSLLGGLASFIASDLIAFNNIGKITSYILFFFILITFMKSPVKGITYILVALFLFPDSPRGIVDIREATLNGGQFSFYTINTTKLGGISLSQLLLLFTTVYLLASPPYDKKFLSVRGVNLLISSLIFLCLVISISTSIDIIFLREPVDYKEIISDAKFFILLFTGTFFGLYFVKNTENPLNALLKLIIFIGLSNGVKTILFLLYDYANTSFSLSFSTQPYMIIPALFAFIMTIKRISLSSVIIIILLFLGGLSISRGDILFFILDLFLFIILVLFIQKDASFKINRLSRLFLIISITVSLSVFTLFTFNQRAYNFLIYKTSFFTTELNSSDISSSPKVRIIEFSNITHAATNLFYPIFIGKGLGSSFDFKFEPAPMTLGPKDYSKKQLLIGKYYKPHTFINYTLLKGGLLFFSLYIGGSIILLLNARRLLRNKDDLNYLFIGSFLVFYSLFYLNMFWLPRYVVFSTFLIVITLSIKDKNESTNMG